MNVNNISGNDLILMSSGTAAETAKTSAIESKVLEKATEKIEAEKSQVRTDTCEFSATSNQQASAKTDETGIYSRESIVEQLKVAEEQRVKAFQDTIRSMMAQQGQVVNLTFRGMDLHVTEEQSAEAKKAISEGGEYSVNSVADRIMNMAEALADGDSSKLSLLREAVQKGFSGAAEALGKNEDEMPDITKDTYNEIMKRFDEWEASFAEKQENAEVTKEAIETETVNSDVKTNVDEEEK